MVLSSFLLFNNITAPNRGRDILGDDNVSFYIMYEQSILILTPNTIDIFATTTTTTPTTINSYQYYYNYSIHIYNYTHYSLYYFN